MLQLLLSSFVSELPVWKAIASEVLMWAMSLTPQDRNSSPWHRTAAVQVLCKFPCSPPVKATAFPAVSGHSLAPETDNKLLQLQKSCPTQRCVKGVSVAIEEEPKDKSCGWRADEVIAVSDRACSFEQLPFQYLEINFQRSRGLPTAGMLQPMSQCEFSILLLPPAKFWTIITHCFTLLF